MMVLLALGLCLSAAGRSGELDGSEWLAVPDAPVATDADRAAQNAAPGETAAKEYGPGSYRISTVACEKGGCRP